MYQHRTSSRIEDVLWTDQFPFKLESDGACVLGGDWDLTAIRTRPPSSVGPACLLPVGIGRAGDLIADARSHYTVDGDRVSVRIIGRHKCWDAFRREILQYVESEGGTAYVPLTHVDLSDIPFWTGPERAQLIKANVQSNGATVLDIGAFWGYMCEELEKVGHTCTAVEIDERNYYFMSRLRRAQRFSYRAVLGDICEFVDNENQFDVVMALAVFHHFIKTESRHRRLLALLQKMKTKQMFFWCHNPQDRQMNGAYRNYAGDEFVELILKHSGLSRHDLIGVIDGRPFYQLT